MRKLRPGVAKWLTESCILLSWGGKSLISFSALGIDYVGGTAEERAKQRARERQTQREIKIHTEKNREERRHRAKERIRKDIVREMRQVKED